MKVIKKHSQLNIPLERRSLIFEPHLLHVFCLHDFEKMFLDFISDQRQVTDPWEKQLTDWQRKTAQVKWQETNHSTAERKCVILTYIVGLCLSLCGFLWRQCETGRYPSEPNISEHILVICHYHLSPGNIYNVFSYWAV